MRDMDRILDETLGDAGPADGTEVRETRVYIDEDADASGAANPDPDATRAEIEQTRNRMSETIDEIEDVLLRKKENIQDRMNVFGTVKSNPLPSVGVAFGAGLLVGFLTGEDDDDDDDDYDDVAIRATAGGILAQTADDEFWAKRASDWEARSRRLLELAQRQEVELSELRGERDRTLARVNAGVRSSYSEPSGEYAAPAPPPPSATRPRTAASSRYEAPTSTREYEVTLEEGDDRWERLRSPLRKAGDTVIESLTDFLTQATRELSGSSSGRR